MAKARKHPDYILIGATALLIVLGILVLGSASSLISQEKFGESYHFLNHQILFGLIPGLILAFLAFHIKLDFLKKWAPFLLLANLILLAMVFLPVIGFGTGGATRWISLGQFSFQPSEFLKLTFIFYLAAWLSGRTEKITSPKSKKHFSKTLIAFLAIIALISLFLILQPDISTLGIIVFTGTLMYFSAQTPLWHTVLIILMGMGGLISLIKIAPYRANRLLIFLNPETDPMGLGYQIKQSLITIGSGGLFGLGLGLSGQKLGFLPHSVSDSVFAIFAEETGFVGSLILISLFLIFLWQGFKISKSTNDKFSQLLALGITSWIVIQGFVNIGSMIGVLPLTGIPLPFISYGGSALIAELVGVGILLNISKKT
ncbi:putative lipid II flippase FtsW [Patescibacteria group bacterium]